MPNALASQVFVPRDPILIVEDNEMNREMLSRRLRRKGFVVLEAADATSGLMIARSQPVGVILMDMSLPEIDGWTATRMLKADAATRPIPVMALTAHAMIQDRDAALAAGCDDFETKPIDFERLVDKIHPPDCREDSMTTIHGRVLVVDDNAANRQMLMRRLERRGFEIAEAEDGPAALHYLATQPCDMVLLDLEMPTMDGMEVLARIRKTWEPDALPGHHRDVP